MQNTLIHKEKTITQNLVHKYLSCGILFKQGKYNYFTFIHIKSIHLYERSFRFFVAGIGYNTSDLQGFDAVAYQYIVNKTWTTQNS